MLTLKKIFMLCASLLCISSLMTSFNTLAAQDQQLTQEQLISQVEYFFKEDAETLNYNKIVKLSNNIILQSENFPSAILAKTYLLLAHVASNKGDLETAFQFTQDGIAIATQDLKTRLCLQIKLASILSAKKQFAQLLTTAQQTIDMQKGKENSKYFLFALSYRSVAFAMLNQHEKALVDLQRIESFIKQTPAFAEHISLLASLANAYYYLGDYQTALTVQLKILKLRYNLNKLANVDQTYYQLANAYYRLNRFNDAYNAYWEAKNYAEKKSAPIYIAFANQGLGNTLIKQQNYPDAITKIEAAKTSFYQHNLALPYVETLISLAQIHNLTGEKDKAAKLLLEAESSLMQSELTDDYILFYRLVANVYQAKKDMGKAYYWLQKYSNALLKLKSPANLIKQPTIGIVNNTNDKENDLASNQTSQLVVKIAEESVLETIFSKKYQQQQVLIIIFLGMTLFLLSLLIFIWLKYRTKKLKSTYEALEKSTDVIATPIQTKQLYQNNFNMARKYSYPLVLGYISISNWQELSFQFNKKIVAEVAREIANLMNKHINEFENVGLINDGEYLLLFPHQDISTVERTINKLLSALKLRFFANLGEFSVTIVYSIGSPNFQDIDPYIFLSQLSDSPKIA